MEVSKMDKLICYNFDEVLEVCKNRIVNGEITCSYTCSVKLCNKCKFKDNKIGKCIGCYCDDLKYEQV